MPRSCLADHLRASCRAMLVPCPNSRAASSPGAACGPFPAKKAKLSCEVKVQRQHLQAHLAECKYREDTCPHEGCRKKLFAKDVGSHVKECEYRLVPCRFAPGCGSQVRQRDLDRHIKTDCPMAPQPCTHRAGDQACGEKVPRGRLATHMAACGFREVRCASQCGAVLCAKDVHAHSCVAFLGQALAAAYARIEALEEQLASQQ